MSEHHINWIHGDVTKWKHFPRYWPFVWRIHRSPVDSPHKGQWRGALMFSLICTWRSGCANNRDACDLRRHRAHYDVTVKRREITTNGSTIWFTMEFFSHIDATAEVLPNEASWRIYVSANRKVIGFLNGLAPNRRCPEVNLLSN